MVCINYVTNLNGFTWINNTDALSLQVPVSVKTASAVIPINSFLIYVGHSSLLGSYIFCDSIKGVSRIHICDQI